MVHARTAVACFGEALIDFLGAPAAPGAARSFLAQPGGAPANVAVGVARLGGRARFVGMLAEDMFGDALLEALRAHGVDVAQVRRTAAAPTALAFVSLDAAGERSFSFYRPPAADLLFRAQDFDEAAFADAAVFHVCSNSLTEPAIAEATLYGMARAADAGALVSLDLNLRPALWPRDADPRPVLWRALALARLVKLSREELAFLAAGDEARVVSRLLDASAEAVVVTDGPAPIRWWTRARAGTAPTWPVEAVDTTAAGDGFVAGLLWRLTARGIGPGDLAAAFDDDAVREDLLLHAAAAGALATTRHGAFAAMPDADAVRALAGTRP
ncbi:carbohydrate kinase [Luteimonas sp. Y-2-2-4F]|nr:carbohydrate kinase [Luteimonas sp. Y-2-2-4F]MCD9033011.1 carbohydrate kinase [Luteimonas sp. Y-2-2-4F]